MHSAEEQKDLRAEIEDLKARLDESEETLRAIRDGEVEALVIGDRLFTLESADAESNRFRGEMLAQVTDMVVVVDGDRRITYINPAAEKKYGVIQSDVLGCPLETVFTNRFTGTETAARRISSGRARRLVAR